ncbi:MAG: hypothetical protein IJU68_04950 [Bacteroidales bacterium]|nr:hypothetical protein [Bacteroidales bacterium]
MFNAFQVASLLDYRKRGGDILSFTELGLVDGFTPELSEALKLFVKLESSKAPGETASLAIHHDLMLRVAARKNDDVGLAAGLRYKMTLGNAGEFNWASRTTYSNPNPSLGTLSAAYYGNKYLGKVVLGHFNARFGQGLAQWSGFSLSHYSSVTSFQRRGTGFSPTGSFSPEFCGAAADFNIGRWSAGLGYSVTGRKPLGYVSWYGLRTTLGISASDNSVSIDFKIGTRNLATFGEAAWKSDGPALAAGVVWTPKYALKYGLLASWNNSIPEFCAGFGSQVADAVIAVSTKQSRFMVKYSPVFMVGAMRLAPSLRLAARRTDVWRLEARGEMSLGYGKWSLNIRSDGVWCGTLGFLAYAEVAREGEKVRFWCRTSAFFIDKWDARIYVYERDAPGNFNVPAYYGRGWSASLYAAWKPHKRHSFYLRLSYLGYPWMTEDKKSKTEAKLQYALSL